MFTSICIHTYIYRSIMRIYIFYVYEYIHTYLHMQERNAYIFAYLFYVVYVHEIHVKIYVNLKCECMSQCECKYTRRFSAIYTYEAPTISRLLRMIRLFCKRALQKRPMFYKRDLQFDGA